MEYGFDNIFANGPTPTPSAVGLPKRNNPEIRNSKPNWSQHYEDGHNVWLI